MIEFLLWAPFAGGLVAAALPARICPLAALAGSLASLALAIVVVAGFDPSLGLQHTVDESWIPALGVRYQLGVDGISVFLVLLTTVLWFASVAWSAARVPERPRLWFLMLGLAESATLGAFLGLALPNFWVALLLQLVLAVMLGWLPASSMGSEAGALEHAKSYVMPTLVLALPTIAIFARFMRSSMLEVINQDYITTARAKGLAEPVVIYQHALKNALIPIITVVGTQLARLLSGAVIVEAIFAWPGLGLLAYESILRRDYPVVLALTLLTGAFILLVNILVDVLYVFVDPRISYS